MSRGHRVTVSVLGSTSNPGDFTWSCSCGARHQSVFGMDGYQAFHLAEEAGHAHIPEDER